MINNIKTIGYHRTLYSINSFNDISQPWVHLEGNWNWH